MRWIELLSAVVMFSKPPDDFAENHRLGEVYVQKKDFRTAVQYLTAAYRANPNDYNNAFDLAQAELEAGDARAARDLVKTLLQRQDRAELHNLLGDCEEAMGNYREAASQYQIAARADPSEQNLFSFGSELLKYHGYREAEQVFRFGAGRFPKSARIQAGLGVAQYSVGEYRDAVETLCRAVDLNPDDARPLDFLGKMVGVAPEIASELAARLKHFAEFYPKNASAQYYYAMSLHALPADGSTNNRTQRAILYLQRAVALSPAFPEAHYQLGMAYEEAGETAKATREYEAAVRYQPDFKSAHYRLAQLYRKTGQQALAEREFEAVKNLRER